MNYQALRKKELLENMIEMMLEKSGTHLLIKHLNKEHLNKITEAIPAERLDGVVVYTDPHEFVRVCRSFANPTRKKTNFSLFGNTPLPDFFNPSGTTQGGLTEKEHLMQFDFDTKSVQIVLSEVLEYSEFGTDTKWMLLFYFPNEREHRVPSDVELVLDSLFI